MTVAEQKYGIAPIPDSSVTYQPDVIIVGGGANSVRSQNDNGFIWTIDGSAAHADELVAGKVFFLTGRAVGRVLDVRKDGGDLVVTVGPVDLTEIVSEADIQIRGMPIDFNEAIAYTYPDFPGRVVSLAMTDLPTLAMPAVFRPVSDPQEAAPAKDVSNLVNFTTSPFIDSSSVGLRVASNGGGLKVSAETSVHLDNPTLDVDIKIASGGVTKALIELKGAAGLTWTFNASTDVGLKANVNGLLQPDTDFSIPVGGIGPVPLAVTVRQRFLIKTGLGVRNSSIGTTGDYAFNGGFRVGYFDKKWDVAGPIGFSAKQSMMQSGTGISIAAAGVDLSNLLKVIVGVGIGGFAAGPYFTFSSAVGLFNGSSLGFVKCEEATLVVKLSGGVGYLIPQSVTKLINSFLSLLNIKYRVDGEGSISPKDGITIINSSSALKGCKAGEGNS